MLTILFNYPGTGGPPPPTPDPIDHAEFTFRARSAIFTFRPRAAVFTFVRA